MNTALPTRSRFPPHGDHDMTASVFKRVTVSTSVNLTKVKDDPANLKGFNIVNATQAAMFVKLYWFRPTASATAPTVGTTTPLLTIQVSNGLSANQSYPDGITAPGQLFYAVTTSAGDGDTTAVSAGGIIGLLYE
jgi:hypothetical protein